MPRRQFIADLQKAQQDVLPLGIHDLQQGEDDGQFEFLFATCSNAGLAVPVKVSDSLLYGRGLTPQNSFT